jgi:hypothetical protein
MVSAIGIAEKLPFKFQFGFGVRKAAKKKRVAV